MLVEEDDRLEQHTATSGAIADHACGMLEHRRDTLGARIAALDLAPRSSSPASTGSSRWVAAVSPSNVKSDYSG